MTDSEITIFNIFYTKDDSIKRYLYEYYNLNYPSELYKILEQSHEKLLEIHIQIQNNRLSIVEVKLSNNQSEDAYKLTQHNELLDFIFTSERKIINNIKNKKD